MWFLKCLALVLIVVNVKCALTEDAQDELNGPGRPLYLTPLLKEGKISEAVKKATVKPFLKNVKSYAGYFTVDKRFGSNLFFWFFAADHKDWERKPVAVWLQGGPGSSSLLGLLVENGPYRVVGKELYRRKYSWHKSCNMIYIDSPVGTGFSFTGTKEGYTRNQTVIGKHLYSAIKQFFTMFPKLLHNDFFLSGESYAGKYVPAFAYAIHKGNTLSRNKKSRKGIHIKLKGLFIGNGLVDPPNMMEYGDYFYQLGLIDSNSLKKFHSTENEIRAATKEKKWHKATELFGKLVLQFIFAPSGSMFQNATGLHQHYNYVNANATDWTPKHTALVSSNWFRRGVHVGARPFDDGTQVAIALTNDFCKSEIHKLRLLLEHYRVLLYNGQLDVICAYPLTVNYLKKMEWSSADEYKKAERHMWKVGGDIAGYYKTAGHLTEVLVRSAGHMVPIDQPLWAYTLFDKFIHNKPLND